MTYWSEWAVAEREHEARERHAMTCVGCDWCTVPALPTPKAAAAPCGREEAVRSWECPLVAAAATGDVAWVKELLASGVDVNEFSPANDYSALIVAAQKGHSDVVRVLLMTGLCDVTKKHMDGYINALDSAMYGYTNLAGFDDEFTPQIRAMIIRAYMETADRITLDTLLQIEAVGAVLPEQIKAFRFGMGIRMVKMYPKAKPGALNLNDPPAAKMHSIMVAAECARRRIIASREIPTKKKKSGGSGFVEARFANTSTNTNTNTNTVVSEAEVAEYEAEDDFDMGVGVGDKLGHRFKI